MNQKGTLPYLVNHLERERTLEGKAVSAEHLWYTLRNALDPKALMDGLPEALRLSAEETEKLLVENGFSDVVAQSKLASRSTTSSGKTGKDYLIPHGNEPLSPFDDLISLEFSPPLSQPVTLPPAQHEAFSLVLDKIQETVDHDVLIGLYRKGIREYYKKFMVSDALEIDRFIAENFPNEYPKYLVNSGIGANEQFNHLVANLNNSNPQRQITWLVIDSPRQLAKLPADANIDNTLFMEFSRSGKTEETVKIHEYTPRQAKRIIFANSGPLKELGLRDRNLILELPDQVSGRFGRNKTPILLAPMHVAKMDTARFWSMIETAAEKFHIASPSGLPNQVAQFIYLHQTTRGINHIYFGCGDDFLICSADELLQFWNEGVNKNGNDISMSRYFGLPRDSHLNIEGLLGNHRTKMGIFLLRDKMGTGQLHPMVSREIDPINPDHQGLQYGDEEIALAEANYQRFAELMPSIKITVHGDLTLDHAAVLGQLWIDLTYCYAQMVNVDPCSNPEIKLVRDRSAKLLSAAARSK